MSLPNCTICGQPIEDGQAYIALVEDKEAMREGGFWYKWEHGCMHHEVENPTIVLGSGYCADIWLREHPSYVDSYFEFVRRRHNVYTTDPPADC